MSSQTTMFMSADNNEVPSAGDGALNPWLYRYPPWYYPHNPKPPSVELTIGNAVKNTRKPIEKIISRIFKNPHFSRKQRLYS